MFVCVLEWGEAGVFVCGGGGSSGGGGGGEGVVPLLT